MFLILCTCTAQLSSQNYIPHSSKCRLNAYASERSTFSLMESLIQEMDSKIQFQMVGIPVLQQLAAPGFEHLKMNVM